MIVLDDILRDRGSRYAAAVGTVRSKAEIEAFLVALCQRRKFAKATHHSWAALLSGAGPLKNDDGEAGAGAVILKMLERDAVTDRIVVVTRWYGGVHLGGDRFAHIVTCTRAALAALRAPLDGLVPPRKALDGSAGSGPKFRGHSFGARVSGRGRAQCATCLQPRHGGWPTR